MACLERRGRHGIVPSLSLQLAWSLLALVWALELTWLCWQFEGGRNTATDLPFWASLKAATKQEEDDNNRGDYDIVTLIHQDDLPVFLKFGLDSWWRYFASSNTRIYAICTSVACDLLQKQKLEPKHHPSLEKLILVPESLFPFSLQDVGKASFAGKTTWIFQQCLKLYSYHVLASPQDSTIPLIKPLYLVMDSDTVALQRTEFVDFSSKTQGPRPIYNIAALSTGAYINDCAVAPLLINEVFGHTTRPAFPPSKDGKTKFTAITHHMMMKGRILNEMLQSIEQRHSSHDQNNISTTPAWKVLSQLKQSVLSEWELYMGWIMTHYRHELVLRQRGYMNSGQLSKSNLKRVRQLHPDLYYFSRHDDFPATDSCCVNAFESSYSSSTIDADHYCAGCDYEPVIPKFQITCQRLGMTSGCHEQELEKNNDHRAGIQTQLWFDAIDSS